MFLVLFLHFVFYSGLLAFLFAYLFLLLFSKERKKEGMELGGWRGSGRN